MEEKFTECVENNRYQVSSLGNVKGVRGHLLNAQKDSKGYLRVFFGYGKAKRVHRLVAKAFIPNPNSLPEVNHLDGDKSNNSVENLEWTSRLGNMRHAYASKLVVNKSGQNASRAILTEEAVLFIRTNYVSRHPLFGQSALGRKFGVTNSCIWRVVHGDNWRIE